MHRQQRVERWLMAVKKGEKSVHEFFVRKFKITNPGFVFWWTDYETSGS